MTAIRAAYNRHGIACANPAPQNSPCGPTGTATLSATSVSNDSATLLDIRCGRDRLLGLSVRGHAGCNFGKTKIGDVTGLSFTDNGVTVNRNYYYNVVAHGSSQSCFGP
jgi:hypothetical protein